MNLARQISIDMNTPTHTVIQMNMPSPKPSPESFPASSAPASPPGSVAAGASSDVSSDVSFGAATRLSDWRGLDPHHRGGVLALGNFDGVHLGHQAVLDLARQTAARLTAPLCVGVFSPHPRRFFRPGGAPFRLMSDDWRVAVLGQLGVRCVYEMPFDRDLSLMSAETFARSVLHEGLGVRAVVVGFDYRFGKDRGGDTNALTAWGQKLGFEVVIQNQLGADGGKYSSSAVRGFLREGKPLDAARLLTRPWLVDGIVMRGNQRGRTIGFPTINLALGELVRPKFGVYAVAVRIRGEDMWRRGVANVGVRPTVDGEQEWLEAHIFDFDEDVYGRRVDVAMGTFIRAERRFGGLDDLKAQIATDAAAARTWWASEPMTLPNMVPAT